SEEYSAIHEDGSPLQKKKPTKKKTKLTNAAKPNPVSRENLPSKPSLVLEERPGTLSFVNMHRHLESVSNAAVSGCIPNTGFLNAFCSEEGLMTLLMDPNSFNCATVLRHSTRPDVLAGSIYCTAAEIMELVLGCSGGELTMVIEIMKSLEGSISDIHPRLCHYPPCWQAANGSLVRMSKTVHQANARGFVNRALYNNTASNLFTAGTKTSIDHLYGKSPILFGVGPKTGGNFKPMFEAPGSGSSSNTGNGDEEAKGLDTDMGRSALYDDDHDDDLFKERAEGPEGKR